MKIPRTPSRNAGISFIGSVTEEADVSIQMRTNSEQQGFKSKEKEEVVS